MNKYAKKLITADTCNICPRMCNVDRTTTFGFCKSPKNAMISKIMIHNWEEPILTNIFDDDSAPIRNNQAANTSAQNDSNQPTTISQNTPNPLATNTQSTDLKNIKKDEKRGCGAIFFASCNLRCIYCQNYKISQLPTCAKSYTPHELAQVFRDLEAQNVACIDLVTPTHFAPEIIKALEIYKPKIPVIYNTSGYENAETIRALKGYVDIFLFDFKYFSNTIAQQYSKAADYPEKCKTALLEAKKWLKNDIFEGKLLKLGIIIRHLLLPKNSEDGVLILKWIEKNLGKNTYVSLLNQYTPEGEAITHPVLKNRPTALEYKRLVNMATSLDMPNVFIQDASSASAAFIPDF